MQPLTVLTCKIKHWN